jgi:hypothetical protein
MARRQAVVPSVRLRPNWIMRVLLSRSKEKAPLLPLRQRRWHCALFSRITLAERWSLGSMRMRVRTPAQGGCVLPPRPTRAASAANDSPYHCLPLRVQQPRWVSPRRPNAVVPPLRPTWRQHWQQQRCQSHCATALRQSAQRSAAATLTWAPTLARRVSAPVFDWQPRIRWRTVVAPRSF